MPKIPAVSVFPGPGARARVPRGDRVDCRSQIHRGSANSSVAVLLETEAEVACEFSTKNIFDFKIELDIIQKYQGVSFRHFNVIG